MGAALAVLLLALGPGFSFAQSAAPSPAVRELIHAARAAEQRQDFAAAAEAYRRLAELRPQDPVILRSLGLAEYLRNNYPAAVKALNKAASLNPELPGVLLYLGISYFRMNRFAEAVEALQKAPERHGDNHLAPYWLGAGYRSLGLLPRAIQELETARKRSPADLEVLYLLSRAYGERSAELHERLLAEAPESAPAKLLRAEDLFAEGAQEPALDLAAEALQAGETIPRARLLRGRVFFQDEKFEQGAEEFRAGLRADPLSAEAHQHLAAYYLDQGQPAEALAHLRFLQKFRPDAAAEPMIAAAERHAEVLTQVWQAPEERKSPGDERLKLARSAYRSGQPENAIALLEQAPEEREAALLLARAYEAAGEIEAAARQWQALVDRAPGDPSALYQLGRLYDVLSERTAGELLERYPDSYRARMLRGEAYERSIAGQSRFEEALTEYKKARELRPEAPGVNYAVGRILWKMQRFDEAVPYLRRELELNPNHGLANYVLGKIHLSRGAEDKAKQHLQAAVEAQPALLEAQRDLGQARMLLGDHEEAVHTFERLVKEHPSDGSLYALLARAYRAAGRMEEAREAARKSQQLKAEQHRPTETKP